MTMNRSATVVLAIAAVVYLAVVQLLRYRRRDRVERRYGRHPRAFLVDMKLDEAFEIVRDLAELEFPTIFPGSVFFALFKVGFSMTPQAPGPQPAIYYYVRWESSPILQTYGIPSISTLLIATGQLRDSTTASKRAADTGVIITEMVLNEPSSMRRIDALARMNYIHGRYRKAGKITNDDMLYTLGLFALEPVRWTEQYDWRPLTEVEKCALGIFWKDLGECMEISFEPLGSRTSAFDDGLAWLESLESWCSRYEARYMIPAESNKEIARATIEIALFNVPKVFHSFVLNLITTLLEPRLRKAMLYVNRTPSNQQEF